ncbi:MAG: hypothetical protein LC808_40615 [Actinobacteria bacterium]|nr:hypothetical protein [Actinomycetota bacterium]
MNGQSNEVIQTFPLYASTEKVTQPSGPRPLAVSLRLVMEYHAANLAALVQPGGRRLGLWAFPALFDPAKQGNVGAIDVAPLVMSRSRCTSHHR